MRYSKDEESILVGILEPGIQDLTIDILNLKADTTLTLYSNVCKESTEFPGIYLWSTNNLGDVNINGFINLLYKMSGTNSDGKTVNYYGKFVYSGYVDKVNDVDLSEVTKKQEEIIETVDIINGRI